MQTVCDEHEKDALSQRLGVNRGHHCLQHGPLLPPRQAVKTALSTLAQGLVLIICSSSSLSIVLSVLSLFLNVPSSVVIFLFFSFLFFSFLFFSFLFFSFLFFSFLFFSLFFSLFFFFLLFSSLISCLCLSTTASDCCVSTLLLTPNDANHGQFRWLLSTLKGVILQTPSTREDVLCSPPQLGGGRTPTGVLPSKCSSRPHCGPSVPVHSSATNQCLRWTVANLPLIIGFAMCCGWLSWTSPRSALPPIPHQALLCGPRVVFRSSPYRRFLPYNGLLKLLHLHTFLCLRTTSWTFSPSRSSALDCRRQRQSNTPLVFPRRQHFGYAFPSAVATTPRHQPQSQSHRQSEGIGLRTHCNFLRSRRCSSEERHSEVWCSHTKLPQQQVCQDDALWLDAHEYILLAQ